MACHSNGRRHCRGTIPDRVDSRAPEHIRKTKPDYLFLLPWNLADEIVSQCSYIRQWGGKFVVASPLTRVLD